MPVIAGVNCGRPNQLQTTFPAFSPLINGAANTRLCDGARGNQLKAIGPRFPASAKGAACDTLEISRCCDDRVGAGDGGRGGRGGGRLPPRAAGGGTVEKRGGPGGQTPP